MKNTVEVRVGNAVREVKVNTLGPRYSTGYVGRAYFCWKSDQYELPYVTIGSKAANDYTRHLVKMFLMEYKRMLLAPKGKSPLHFKKSDAASSVSNSKKQPTISGVPHWMREEHKVWTECFYKDGSGSYFRRTRFKPESRKLIEKYLPHCSHCPFRVSCEKPCKEPDLMSQSEIFQNSDKKVQPKAPKPSESASGRLDVYVDGSFSNGRYSWSYVVYNGDTVVHEDYGIGQSAEAASMHNVAGELSAAMRAAKWAAANKKLITIHHDYQGVASWVDGSWKAKNDFTRAYRDFMSQYADIVRFNKVKGHTGVEGNERADQLARKVLGI